MKQKLLILFLFLFIAGCAGTTSDTDDFLVHLMNREPERFSPYLQQLNKFEIQVIYSRIDRDERNNPSFQTFFFNVDTTRYFYPASTVKLPLVLLALEKVNRLKQNGIDKFTPVFHDSLFSGQRSVRSDTTSPNGLPSLAHYAKKILVVSDNDAFNRLYEFVGQREIHERLHEMGYSLRILHRLERPLSEEQNRHTERVRFVRNDSVLYVQPLGVNPTPMVVRNKVLKGKGYMKQDELVHEPFDFTYKNFFSLRDQHEMLKAIVFPEAVEKRKRFDIPEEDRRFVLQYMSQLPGETQYPPYFSDTTYYDAYCKFLLFGSERKRVPASIRIFNKVGDAYGYLIDNAYLVDFENGIEFMLSAVIHVNEDGVYNDGIYEYDSLGFPFLKYIGEAVYRYELTRVKKHTPDLSSFHFNYDRIND